jgi:hypothetical protein
MHDCDLELLGVVLCGIVTESFLMLRREETTTTWRVERKVFRPGKDHYFTESLPYHPEHINYLNKKKPFSSLRDMVFLSSLPAVFKS